MGRKLKTSDSPISSCGAFVAVLSKHKQVELIIKKPNRGVGVVKHRWRDGLTEHLSADSWQFNGYSALRAAARSWRRGQVCLHFSMVAWCLEADVCLCNRRCDVSCSSRFKQLTAGKLHVRRPNEALSADKSMLNCPLYPSSLCRLLTAGHEIGGRRSLICLTYYRPRAHLNRFSVRRGMYGSLPLLSAHTYTGEIVKRPKYKRIILQF